MNKRPQMRTANNVLSGALLSPPRVCLFRVQKNGQILQSRRTRGAFQMQAGSLRLHGKRVESLDNPLDAMIYYILQRPIFMTFLTKVIVEESFKKVA